MPTRVTKDGHTYEEPEVNFTQFWLVEVGFDMSDDAWKHNDNVLINTMKGCSDPGEAHKVLYDQSVQKNRSIVAELIEEAIINEFGLPMVKVSLSLSGETHG